MGFRWNHYKFFHCLLFCICFYASIISLKLFWWGDFWCRWQKSNYHTFVEFNRFQDWIGLFLIKLYGTLSQRQKNNNNDISFNSFVLSHKKVLGSSNHWNISSNTIHQKKNINRYGMLNPIVTIWIEKKEKQIEIFNEYSNIWTKTKQKNENYVKKGAWWSSKTLIIMIFHESL